MDDVGFDHEVLIQKFCRIPVIGPDSADPRSSQHYDVGSVFRHPFLDPLLKGEVQSVSRDFQQIAVLLLQAPYDR